MFSAPRLPRPPQTPPSPSPRSWRAHPRGGGPSAVPGGALARAEQRLQRPAAGPTSSLADRGRAPGPLPRPPPALVAPSRRVPAARPVSPALRAKLSASCRVGVRRPDRASVSSGSGGGRELRGSVCGPASSAGAADRTPSGARRRHWPRSRGSRSNFAPPPPAGAGGARDFASGSQGPGSLEARPPRRRGSPAPGARGPPLLRPGPRDRPVGALPAAPRVRAPGSSGSGAPAGAGGRGCGCCPEPDGRGREGEV